MLRATSEIAVATSVRLVPARPACAAMSRPRCRAVTMSESWAIGTRVSAGMVAASPHPAGEQLETLLEVERGGDAVERQAELDHRERDVGLDADDDRRGAAQLGRL